MPGIFPGVDPYIEAQGRWPDFHASFITYLRDALFDRLPQNYEAAIEEQFRLYESDDEPGLLARPDVAVLRTGKPRGEEGGVAVVELVEPVNVPIAAVDREDYRHTWIEIKTLPERSLVAVVELLSPTNKYGQGRNDYLRKRRSYLGQSVHLIELDFLLAGHRMPMGAPMPPGDCFAVVARAERRPDAEVYAWSIRRALPPIPIPLRTPDPDVRIELASVYATAYDRGRYARRLDYSAALPLPLAEPDQQWAAELVTAATKR
jgi:Uma2 family endonuclease